MIKTTLLLLIYETNCPQSLSKFKIFFFYKINSLKNIVLLPPDLKLSEN